MTTITIDRSVVEQALEALENGKRVRAGEGGTKFQIPLEDNAITALRATLAQQEEPVQEPVAWRHKGAGHFTVTPLVSKFPEWEPLYATPPQRKPLAEWQINDLMAGIDPEDVCSWSFRQGVYAAEKHHGVKP